MTALRRKLLIVGDDDCGKICLLTVFSTDRFPNLYIPAVFLPTVANIEVDGKTVELEIREVKGLQSYRRLLAMSYMGSHVILMCFSIDSPGSLESIRQKYIREVRFFCPNVPIVLVGNKKDLRNDENTKRILAQVEQEPVKYEKGASIGREIKACAYLECSAKTREGVRDVFEMAAKATLEDPLETKKNRYHRKCAIL